MLGMHCGKRWLRRRCWLYYYKMKECYHEVCVWIRYHDNKMKVRHHEVCVWLRAYFEESFFVARAFRMSFNFEIGKVTKIFIVLPTIRIEFGYNLEPLLSHQQINSLLLTLLPWACQLITITTTTTTTTVTPWQTPHPTILSNHLPIQWWNGFDQHYTNNCNRHVIG